MFNSVCEDRKRSKHRLSQTWQKSELITDFKNTKNKEIIEDVMLKYKNQAQCFRHFHLFVVVLFPYTFSSEYLNVALIIQLNQTVQREEKSISRHLKLRTADYLFVRGFFICHWVTVTFVQPCWVETPQSITFKPLTGEKSNTVNFFTKQFSSGAQLMAAACPHRTADLLHFNKKGQKSPSQLKEDG